MLLVDAGTLRWRHSLTREAVLSLVLPPELALLSRRAAEALLARGRREDDDAAADLLLRAGANDAVADLLLTLARRDMARGPSTPPSASSTTCNGPGCAPRQPRSSVSGCSACAGGPARPWRWRVRCSTMPRVASTSSSRSSWLAPPCRRDCWDDVREYVGRAGRPQDPRSETLLADAAHGAGRLDDAARHAAAAVAGAEAAGDAEQLCDALVVHAKVLRLEDTKAARALFDRVAQVASEHGLVDARVEAMLGQATLEMLESETTRTLEAARELAEQAGLVGQLTAIDMLRVDALVVSEGPAAAVPLARELLDRARTLSMPAAAIGGAFVIALAAAASGDRGETERLMAPAHGDGGRSARGVPRAGRGAGHARTRDE